MLKRGISTRFNDAASRGYTPQQQYIDTRDATTANILASKGLLPRHPVEMASIEGLDLRNACIVENAKKHIKDTKVKIYVQHCGMAHMMGGKGPWLSNGEQYSYKNSLADLFNKEGMHVVPFFHTVTHPLMSFSPPNTNGRFKSGVITKGLYEAQVSSSEGNVERAIMANVYGNTEGIKAESNSQEVRSIISGIYRQLGIGMAQRVRPIVRYFVLSRQDQAMLDAVRRFFGSVPKI